MKFVKAVAHDKNLHKVVLNSDVNKENFLFVSNNDEQNYISLEHGYLDIRSKEFIKQLAKIYSNGIKFEKC